VFVDVVLFFFSNFVDVVLVVIHSAFSPVVIGFMPTSPALIY